MNTKYGYLTLSPACVLLYLLLVSGPVQAVLSISEAVTSPALVLPGDSFSVTITGTDFLPGASVNLGGISVPDITVVNATTITGNTPPIPAGFHNITVLNPDGESVTEDYMVYVAYPQQITAGDLAPRGRPDNTLNVADLLLLTRFVQGYETPNQRERIAANVAPFGAIDEQINVADALMLQRAILEDITLAPLSDDQGPDINVIWPVDGQTVSGESIVIAGTADEWAELIIGYEFTNTDAFLAFSHQYDLALEGENTVQIQALDLYFNESSHTFTVIRDTLPPPTINTLLLTLTQSGGVLTVTGSDGTVEAGATLAVTANGRTYTTTADANGAFTLDLNAVAGDRIQIVATDAVLNSTQPIDYVVGATLQTVSPADGAVIDIDNTNIVGIFSGDLNSGINVNGVTACTYNNYFYINKLPLSQGNNNLTVTETPGDGSVRSAYITVTATSSAGPIFSADKNCGVAPLDVNFNVAGGSIDQLEIDYDNDGVVDVATTTPETAALQHTFTLPGVYPITAWLTAGAVVRQLSLNIVVNDETQQDEVLQAVWNGMWSALLAGDRVSALDYLTPGGERVYGGIFDSLMPHMTEVFDELSVIEPVEINSNIASYAVLRMESGVIKTYLINFLRGSDGLWRIDSM